MASETISGAGSSPRVRGTRNSLRPVRPARSVHPRVCGEHGNARRGRCARPRFIPACAGNTSPSPAFRPTVAGSSPRVRGTPCGWRGTACGCRFIPACAGNTFDRHPERAAAHGSSPRVRGTRREDARDAQPVPVHPRVCGEHASRLEVLGDGAGSSPRVRGTHEFHHVAGRGLRFIPACAGNTLRGGGRPARATGSSPRVRGTRHDAPIEPIECPVHPRVCGEHTDQQQNSRIRDGSSPRVRGTQLQARYALPRRRFIPACAGNTAPATRPRRRVPVHPRVCGEHCRTKCALLASDGSSPRVRGTRQWWPCVRTAWRFIPACAGNTAMSRAPPSRATVHPRVCGEHALGVTQTTAWYGSSPRVRGTRRTTTHPARRRRFIPACAGNTLDDVVGDAALHGSSPRVRGTLPMRSQPFPPNRFIPACAGNTGLGGLLLNLPPVHPRVCGEHTAFALALTARYGSSPRVRGTLGAAEESQLAARFIPACAGNTELPALSVTTTAVHPRVCGEHATVPCGRLTGGGSSPRVRGTP